jgi:hypothetical protein
VKDGGEGKGALTKCQRKLSMMHKLIDLVRLDWIAGTLDSCRDPSQMVNLTDSC